MTGTTRPAPPPRTRHRHGEIAQVQRHDAHTEPADTSSGPRVVSIGDLGCGVERCCKHHLVAAVANAAISRATSVASRLGDDRVHALFGGCQSPKTWSGRCLNQLEPARTAPYRRFGETSVRREAAVGFSAGEGSERPPSVEDVGRTLGPMSRLGRITTDAATCHGRPTVRGLRYPVETLLELLASGMSIDEVLADCPDVERDDLLAALELGALASGNRVTAFGAPHTPRVLSCRSVSAEDQSAQQFEGLSLFLERLLQPWRWRGQEDRGVEVTRRG